MTIDKPPSVDVEELQRQLAKKDRLFKRACRAAREAEIRAERAEKLLDATHGVLAGLKQPKIEKELIVKSEPIEVVEVAPNSTAVSPEEERAARRKARNWKKNLYRKQRKERHKEAERRKLSGEDAEMSTVEATLPTDGQPRDSKDGVRTGLKQQMTEKETIVNIEPMEIVEVAPNSTAVSPPEESDALPVGRNTKSNQKKRRRAKEMEAERRRLTGEDAEMFNKEVTRSREEGPRAVIRATEEIWAARERLPSSFDPMTAFVRLQFIPGKYSVFNFFNPLRISTIKMALDRHRQYKHSALVTFATIEDARAAKDYEKKGCKIYTSKSSLPLNFKRYSCFSIYSAEKDGVLAGLKQPTTEKETIVNIEPIEIVEVAPNSTVVNPPEENAASLPVGSNTKRNRQRRRIAKEKEAERRRLSGDDACDMFTRSREEGPRAVIRATEEIWASRECLPLPLDPPTAFVRLQFLPDKDSVFNFFSPLRISTIKMALDHQRVYKHAALITFATLKDAQAAKDYEKKGCKIYTSRSSLPLNFKRYRYFTIYNGEKKNGSKHIVWEEVEEVREEAREEMSAGESTECRDENGWKKKRRNMDYLYNRLLERIASQ